LTATPGILILGRVGTPDALSCFAIVAGCLALFRQKLLAGILLLMLSIWVRTDNVIFALIVLGWLVLEHKLSVLHSTLLAALAVGSVECINSISGNYGLKVLFQYSFIGGKYPAELIPDITLSTYLLVVLHNARSIVPQSAPWVLLGIAAWTLKSPERKLLIPVAIASTLHYVLFPSGEARYFAWAYMLTGVVFILAVQQPKSERALAESS
jgi:hypothetical protein